MSVFPFPVGSERCRLWLVVIGLGLAGGAGADWVPVRTEELPCLHPNSGEQRTLQNPVNARETRTVTQELHRLMFDGRLRNWRLGVQKQGRYYE